MKQIQNYLSVNKSLFQKITLLILVLFPILMFVGAKANSTLLIVISLIFVILANIMAALNK